jgi:hypothetical protein
MGHGGRGGGGTSRNPAGRRAPRVYVAFSGLLLVFLPLLLVFLILRGGEPRLSLAAAVHFPGEDRGGGGLDGVPPNCPIILRGRCCWRGAVEPAPDVGDGQLCLVPIIIFVLLGRYLVIVVEL